MIAIIGGGICGLGIGWRLAQAGEDVTVYDRGVAGMEATWAAAGMLAPQAEAEHGEEALLPLALESRAMWKEFAAELLAVTGIDVDYREEGTMVVGLDRDDVEHLEHRFSYFQSLGLDVQWLSGYEARKREPHLARAVGGAVYSALDHQVDNRKVAEALRSAFVDAGGTLKENVEIIGVATAAGRVSAIETADGSIETDTVVLAAGAWSRKLGGLPETSRPPVRPLKGQMVAVQMEPQYPLIESVIWGPGNGVVPSIYLAPKSNGRLIIGATVEEMGFDIDLTAGGVMELLKLAWDMLPGIYDLPLVESWAGLRPASRDDAPILGPTPTPGLILATGHHRNGILLAPLTAKAISDFVRQGEVGSSIKPFLLDRFEKAVTANV
ncbi:MAG: glycine oxidase ThiO [Alphaproteobacteria bacterium]|nr:glycine oxidase ThiO [Alphaproteobacteria bacterium]